MGITISTLDYTDEIKTGLVNFNFAEQVSKDYTLFKIDDSDLSKNIKTGDYLAGIIADIVIDKVEKKFINRIIEHKYQHFSIAERNKIQELTIDHLNNVRLDRQLGDFVRKNEIISQIKNYFKQNQDLNIEGFVRFRLKDYLDDLKLAVERSVDDFIIEKEYNEFIELLKYFVDLQEPRISMVHVIQKEDGSFQIMDKLKNRINNEYLEGYFAEMFDEEIEYEDLLVSALINVAPEKILLHFNDDEVEDTVKKIFSTRVEVCTGCQLCERE